jgi:hypothetical protein
MLENKHKIRHYALLSIGCLQAALLDKPYGRGLFGSCMRWKDLKTGRFHASYRLFSPQIGRAELYAINES